LLNYKLEVFDEMCTFSPTMSDHLVGASPNSPIFVDYHDNPSELEQTNCNVFCQTQQSDNNGRFKLTGTQESSHAARFGFDGDQLLIWLHKARSPPQGGKIHSGDDGASLRARKIFRSMIILKTKIPSRLHQSCLMLGRGGKTKI
jgi:hypothetical protein